ncbi:MAG: hypothetical protein RTU92_01140 [Candidatus Thorarchaeota archaeon]
MKRVLPILVIALFLAGIFIVPVGVTTTPARLQETTALNDVIIEQDTELAWLPADKTVRVAIYSESNLTDPDYATFAGVEHNNATGLRDILIPFGYDMTILTASDVCSGILTTVNYDVFVMVDNFPRENTTNWILDFWKGGGGLLAFDGSAGFLCYFGILPPEAALSDGNPAYWDFGSENFIIETRHPVSKGYQDQQVITMGFQNCLMWDWSALQGTAIANDLTMVASSSSNANDVVVLAYDPSTGLGGKVVTIAADNDGVTFPELDQMIADACEWITPLPKGRVLYDLSHTPFYGPDTWDSDYVFSSSVGLYHSIQRQDAISQGYTFDKLYPSASGNLTTANLELYDVLIVNGPYGNFTAQEVTDVSNWVSSGGSLFVIGEYLATPLHNLNYLLINTNMQLHTVVGSNSLSQVGTHVIHENAITVSCMAPGTVLYTAPAVPIWDDGAGHVVIAVEEYGAGRIALADDTALFRDNRIVIDDNRDVATNIMNWLAAGDVLIYAGEGGSSDNPNNPNPYRGPVASALNSLGIPFLLTTDLVYFNLSLATEAWELIVVDHPASGINPYCLEMLDHMNAGGKMVISSWQMMEIALEPLWDYLGVSYAGNSFTTPPTIYLWDDAHPVFTIPVDYGADNLTTSIDYVSSDCGNLTIHQNGTALAGLGATQSTTNAAIVLGANGRAITNAMLVTAYGDDTDDSTYADSVELWRGEIAFLMRPEIDSPSDIVLEAGSSGESLTWSPRSDRPYRYILKESGFEIFNNFWDGNDISFSLVGDPLGDFFYELTVFDSVGYTAQDSVTVTVEDTTSPSWIDSPDNLQYQEGTTEHLLNWSFTDLLPDSWWLLIDNVTVDSGAWDGSNISVDVGGFTEGVYNVTLAVNDTSGNWASSIVALTVTAALTTTTTTTTETGTTTPPPLDTTVIIIIIVIAGVVVIIIIIIMKKKS